MATPVVTTTTTTTPTETLACQQQQQRDSIIALKLSVRKNMAQAKKKKGKQGVAPAIDKNARMERVRKRRKAIRTAAAKSKISSIAWDLIKKRAGCARMRKDVYPLLKQCVLGRMKAVLSRALTVSERKMLHASDVQVALESLDSAVAI